MARKFHTFQSGGLFFCVSLKGDRVFGPYVSERQVRAAKPLITKREHSDAVCDANPERHPQPLPERDVNPLTR